jgi:hypothetical protein
MTVIPFRREPAQPGWTRTEIGTMSAAFAPALSQGDASGWVAAETEAGDPQLYLLGPAPEQECVASVSRLGRVYVLEDGQGRILFEHNAMGVLAEQLRGMLRRKKTAFIARLTVAWVAVREIFEEKVEPVLAEPSEILSLVAPQLGALA